MIRAEMCPSFDAEPESGSSTPAFEEGDEKIFMGRLIAQVLV
jgi:hypothetical protein